MSNTRYLACDTGILHYVVGIILWLSSPIVLELRKCKLVGKCKRQLSMLKHMTEINLIQRVFLGVNVRTRKPMFRFEDKCRWVSHPASRCMIGAGVIAPRVSPGYSAILKRISAGDTPRATKGQLDAETVLTESMTFLTNSPRPGCTKLSVITPKWGSPPVSVVRSVDPVISC